MATHQPSMLLVGGTLISHITTILSLYTRPTQSHFILTVLVPVDVKMKRETYHPLRLYFLAPTRRLGNMHRRPDAQTDTGSAHDERRKWRSAEQECGGDDRAEGGADEGVVVDLDLGRRVGLCVSCAILSGVVGSCRGSDGPDCVVGYGLSSEDGAGSVTRPSGPMTLVPPRSSTVQRGIFPCIPSSISAKSPTPAPSMHPRTFQNLPTSHSSLRPISGKNIGKGH